MSKVVSRKGKKAYIVVNLSRAEKDIEKIYIYVYIYRPISYNCTLHHKQSTLKGWTATLQIVSNNCSKFSASVVKKNHKRKQKIYSRIRLWQSGAKVRSRTSFSEASHRNMLFVWRSQSDLRFKFKNGKWLHSCGSETMEKVQQFGENGC